MRIHLNIPQNTQLNIAPINNDRADKLTINITQKPKKPIKKKAIRKRYSIRKDELTREQLLNELHNARLLKGCAWVNTKEDIDFITKGILPPKKKKEDGTPKRRCNCLIFIGDDLTIYRVFRRDTAAGTFFNLRGTTYQDFTSDPALNNTGYVMISLKNRTVLYHRIIALNFDDVICKPKEWDTSYEVDHIDRDKLNNRPSNLRWTTHRDNMLAYQDDLREKGISHKGISHRDFGRYYYKKGELHIDGERIPMSIEQYIAYRKRHGLTLKCIRRSGYSTVQA